MNTGSELAGMITTASVTAISWITRFRALINAPHEQQKSCIRPSGRRLCPLFSYFHQAFLE